MNFKNKNGLKCKISNETKASQMVMPAPYNVKDTIKAIRGGKNHPDFPIYL